MYAIYPLYGSLKTELMLRIFHSAIPRKFAV